MGQCRLAAATMLAALARAPSRATFVRRAFAGLPAVADPAKEVVASAPRPATPAVAAAKPAAAPAAAAPPPPPPPAAPRGSSAWQRLVAFTTGVGVASAWFYYSLDADVSESTAAIDASLAAFTADIRNHHADLSARLAVVEHQLAAKGK